MANRFARKAGNHNATDVWSDTPSGTAAAGLIPGPGDVAYANNFDIQIVADWAVDEVRNDVNGSGATGGKGFFLAEGVTLTADVYGSSAAGGNAGCVAPSGNASAAVIGDFFGGSSAGKSAISNSGSGTIAVTGNGVGGGNYGCHGIINSGAGAVTLAGTVTGGAGTSGVGTACHGAVNTGTGTLSVTNAVGGGSNAATQYGAMNTGAGTLIVTGTATANVSPGAGNSGTGILRVGHTAPSLTQYAVVADTGSVQITKPLRRRVAEDGGDPAMFPINARRWDFLGGDSDDYILEMYDSEGSIVEYRQATARISIDVNLAARLAQCSTVDSTGAQIAALS